MKFTNVVLTLPADVKAEIDALIEKQCSGRSISSTMKEKYPESTGVVIPSLPTLLKYIRYYQTSKRDLQRNSIEKGLITKLETGIVEINQVLVQVSQGQSPNFDKVRLLEGLAGKCLQRVKRLEDLTEDSKKPIPSVENAIVRYLSTVKDIIQSSAELSSDAPNDRDLIQLVKAETRELLELVKTLILEICPEKYEEFRLRLQDKLQTMPKQEPVVVEAEATPAEPEIQELDSEGEIPLEQDTAEPQITETNGQNSQSNT
jgi:hypothetical protein